MATSRSAWKRAESGLAAIFGALRRPLSGSANRPDLGEDDAIHPRLYLESKLRASHAVWTLWRDANRKAGKCRKSPVLGLREKGKHGILLVIHSDDFDRVIVERLAAIDVEAVLRIERDVRVARLGIEEDG